MPVGCSAGRERAMCTVEGRRPMIWKNLITQTPDVAGFVHGNTSVLALGALGAAGLLGAAIASAAPADPSGFDAEIARHAQSMLDEGRKTFRNDTFGSEGFWGDALELHKAIAGAKNGGVGPGVSPKTALSVGLKVDADALPDALKKELAAGKVDLDDPATTIAL